jgi:hypothetical protein
MSGDALTRNLDEDAEAVVTSHEAACDQRWEFHTVDYTTGAWDDKRHVPQKPTSPLHKITCGQETLAF